MTGLQKVLGLWMNSAIADCLTTNTLSLKTVVFFPNLPKIHRSKSYPAADPAHCSEPAAAWHGTWWRLMSWEEAAEILNLCHKREKKDF